MPITVPTVGSKITAAWGTSVANQLNRVGARVSTNATQAITANTITTWNNGGTAAWTVLEDNYSGYTFASATGGTTTPLIVPSGAAGLYLVGLSLTMSAVAATRGYGEIRINGAAFQTLYGRTIFATDTNASYCTPIVLNVGDTIGAVVFTSTAGNLNTTSEIFAYRMSA